MFDTIRRLVDDSYRAEEADTSVGLPRVTVDASQLKNLLDSYDQLYGFVWYIANDYVELSHEKIRIQRDDYIRVARNLLRMEDCCE